MKKSTVLLFIFNLFLSSSLSGLADAGQESIKLVNLYTSSSGSLQPTVSHSGFAISVSDADLAEVSTSVLMAEAWLRRNVLARYPSAPIAAILVGGDQTELSPRTLQSLKNVHHSLTRWGLETEIKVSASLSSSCLRDPQRSDFFRLVMEFLRSKNSTYTIKLSPFSGSESMAAIVASHEDAMSRVGVHGLRSFNLIPSEPEETRPELAAIKRKLQALSFPTKPVPSNIAKQPQPASPPENESAFAPGTASPPENDVAFAPKTAPPPEDDFSSAPKMAPAPENDDAFAPKIGVVFAPITASPPESDAALPPYSVLPPENGVGFAPPKPSLHEPRTPLPPPPPYHYGPTLPPCYGPSPPPPHARGLWCVAKPSVPGDALQAAMDYACGEGGADCAAIAPGGQCFSPDTAVAHASYAFNAYWQRHKRSGGTCAFGGTAMLINTDPSFLQCRFILT